MLKAGLFANMSTAIIFPWKRTPFLRLLPPFAAGIILQWHLQVPVLVWLTTLAASCIIVFSFFFIGFFKRYKLSFLPGIAACLLFIALGASLSYNKDIRNKKNWLGNFYQENDGLIVTLNEPLVEKTRSFKANATVSYLIKNGKTTRVIGSVILYFKKNTVITGLGYGSQIFFKKNLQEIKNSGNPGGFDYKRYCIFQGITHQVFLKPGEFEILDGKKQHSFRRFIYTSREKVLDILRAHIPGGKELGLAEALLIGYKNDLDQSLVQSYTNTGVVHIIAISGLHLGLIYWLLALLTRPMQNKRRLKWLRPLLIIGCLWLFSLLAGAQPSVLRSALMFTCIVIGEGLTKKTSVFNSLAFSAFILLLINPYWLWDVGFQLSYAAVLSIIIFFHPVYNWFYIKNKILDLTWKLNAVTLAAQVLTVPLSIYHFHQFPNYFWLTNFVAVPLSSIILLGEIFLCAIAWIPAIALLTGKLLKWLIGVMNTWIEKIESLYFSLWDGLQITLVQTLLLILFAAGISNWLMEKSKKGLIIGLTGILVFFALRSFSFIQSNSQQKIIVYNVPQKRAIDFIDKRNYLFVGDSDLVMDDFARNFHLKPTRTLFRITPVDSLQDLHRQANYLRYGNKNILLIDSNIIFLPIDNKPVIDLLLISKNPRIYISKLVAALDIKQVVFDGSVPAWKTVYWKKDCDSLGIPWHDVTTKGAFVMPL